MGRRASLYHETPQDLVLSEERVRMPDALQERGPREVRIYLGIRNGPRLVLRVVRGLSSSASVDLGGVCD